MSELAPRIIAILRAYADDPIVQIGSATRLGALEIDRLDLPMVILDIEDACNIHIGFDDEIEDVATVGDFVHCISLRVAAKTSSLRQLAATPRIKRSWLSTSAEPLR
jgi:acyl carrier protein